MTEIDRTDILDEMDRAYDQFDGSTPDHLILASCLEDEVRLEQLSKSKRFRVVSAENNGLIGMQVWFSSAVDERDKSALLLSDDAMCDLFPRAKDFYIEEP